MYKLHYASIDLEGGNIPCHEFTSHYNMVDFIDQKCVHRKGDIVWLLAKDGIDDIFISESYLSIQDFLSNKYLWQTSGEYYLQEYRSYEDAYSVALSMQEENDLCYNKK